VGLLGSPCFEIPRVVERDRSTPTVLDDATRRRRIAEKTRHNVVTMLAFLGGIWFYSFVFLLTALIALLHFHLHGVLAIMAFGTFNSLLAIFWFSFIERASLGFGRLTPRIASMYDRYFWFHERHWKLAPTSLMSLFPGTPFKNVMSRLLGVRVGKKVFDDGARFCEKTLIEIGDYANLNEACLIHGHSLEEGVFKSDYVRVGRCSTVGSGALVHYGVRMGENVVLGPDSFLMKGESPEANTVWCGNPAKIVYGAAAPRLAEVDLPAPAGGRARAAAAPDHAGSLSP
jgi:non-ribosomal peptide synthetase-like protein